jgi:hypothetical protein
MAAKAITCKNCSSITSNNVFCSRGCYSSWRSVTPEQTRKRKREYWNRWSRTTGRESVNETARNRAREIRSYLIAVKETTPCADCGLSFPHYVMQFDHVGMKKDTVSRLVTRGWGAVQRELEKCEAVCANCHCIRTWERRINRKAVKS